VHTIVMNRIEEGQFLIQTPMGQPEVCSVHFLLQLHHFIYLALAYVNGWSLVSPLPCRCCMFQGSVVSLELKCWLKIDPNCYSNYNYVCNYDLN